MTNLKLQAQCNIIFESYEDPNVCNLRSCQIHDDSFITNEQSRVTLISFYTFTNSKYN